MKCMIDLPCSHSSNPTLNEVVRDLAEIGISAEPGSRRNKEVGVGSSGVERGVEQEGRPVAYRAEAKGGRAMRSM
jgi:hypothetical protein